MTSAISAQGLSKSYGPVKAVVDIHLDVRRGEIYGFLGRNGAGKTTTIRMLLGLVRPSAGVISILGSALGDDRKGVLSRIGYLVESAAAYPNLTVRENLAIQRRLTRAPAGSRGRGHRAPQARRVREPPRGQALAGQQAAALPRARHGPRT